MTKHLLLCLAIVTTLLLPVYAQPKVKPGITSLSDHQQHVVVYFKEIALGFEYGSTPQVTRKWKKPMKIFVGGSPTAALTAELQLIVNELNTLITDDFNIEIVSSREASNFYIFFGTSSAYGAQYPVDARLAASNSGIFRIYWNNNNEITKGHIFVKMTGTSEKEQRHVLREELTQSLGLGRDSREYAESIFQSAFTTPTQYAPIDEDIIRLLYHHDMTSGLSAQEIEVILTEILLKENGA